MSGTRPPSNLPDESQQWRRSLEEDIEELKRQGGIVATNSAATRQAQGAIASAIARANLDIADQAEAIKDARRIPAAPSSPAVSTDAYFDEYGTPRAKVLASSDMVLQDTKGAPIDVAYHELFGRPSGSSGTAWQKLAETYTLPPSFEFSPLPAGQIWDFSIGAVSTVGVAGERSATVTALLAKDTTAPPKPSKPNTSSRLGQVMINWDGKAADGSSQPADFSHAEVLMATSLAAVGVKVGTIDKDGDTFYAPEIPYNTTRWYYLIAVDVAGNRSPASDRADVMTKPLVDTDLIGRVIDGANVKLESIQADVIAAKAITESKISDAVNDKIATAVSDAANANTNANTAITAANGKNRIIFSTSPASGSTGYVNGDTWFQRTGGLIIAQWEFGSGSWGPRTLDNAVIANLDAGKIVTGFLDAARLDAGTITAEKLAVADFTNYASGSDFEDATKIPWTLNSAASRYASTTRAHSGSYSLYIDGAGASGTAAVLRSPVATAEGEQWYIEFWVSRSAAWNGTTSNSKLRIGDQANSIIASLSYAATDMAANTAPLKFSTTFTVPAGKTGLKFTLVSDATAGGVWIDDIVIRRMNGGELIVDGAITAGKIATNAVEASHIKAGAVVAGKIAANSVGANEIIANSITANEIAANAVTASELAALSVEAGHVKANAITADKIDAGAVTTVKLAAGAVTADKVTARSITTDKLTIGNTSNLIDDPQFATPIGLVWKPSASNVWTLSSSSGRAECTSFGAYRWLQNNDTSTGTVIVVPGERYQVSVDAYNTLTVGKLRVQVAMLDAADATVQNVYLESTASGWASVTREVIVPAGTMSMRLRLEVVDTTSATTGRAIFTLPRLIRKATAELIVDGAVTAEKISADAIDGKTITGALLRSAASGARTEMNASGIRVINSASQELVRIGYGIATGMSVRDPSSGALVPLAPHVFGTVAGAKTNSISFAPTNAWSAWTDEFLSTTPVQSPTGRLAVHWAVGSNLWSAFNFQAQIVVDLMHGNTNGAAFTRIVDTEDMGGSAAGFAVVDVPASTNRWLRMSYRAYGQSPGATLTLYRRSMMAMPI